jgi:predicted DNA-binding protein (MmcQ/YjbR family)
MGAPDNASLDEKETRIRQMLADIELKALDRVKRPQEIADAPHVSQRAWITVATTGALAVAAIFTALGAQLAHWFGH